MRYVISGSRVLPPAARADVSEALECLVSGTRFVTGAQVGIDTFAALTLARAFPEAHHTIVVPALKHNESVVEWVTEALGREPEVIRMPAGSTYSARNLQMLALGDAVVAFPLRSEAEQRSSGTWHTVRHARKAEMPVSGFILTTGEMVE